jgi:hypothetical protein
MGSAAAAEAAAEPTAAVGGPRAGGCRLGARGAAVCQPAGPGRRDSRCPGEAHACRPPGSIHGFQQQRQVGRGSRWHGRVQQLCCQRLSSISACPARCQQQHSQTGEHFRRCATDRQWCCRIGGTTGCSASPAFSCCGYQRDDDSTAHRSSHEQHSEVEQPASQQVRRAQPSVPVVAVMPCAPPHHELLNYPGLICNTGEAVPRRAARVVRRGAGEGNCQAAAACGPVAALR